MSNCFSKYIVGNRVLSTNLNITDIIQDHNNWASEASPTLGCSIEISRDIYKTYYTGQRGI